MTWQLIDTAPRDGSDFLATNCDLIGVGAFFRNVENDTVDDWTEWREFRDTVKAPFEFSFTADGLFPEGFDFLENRRLESKAWEEASKNAPAIGSKPNPKAGEVTEWFYASAFDAESYPGKALNYDGPIGFEPTHWQPLPTPPAATKTQLPAAPAHP